MLARDSQLFIDVHWNHRAYRLASWAGVVLLAATLLGMAFTLNWVGIGVIGPFLLFSVACTLQHKRIPSLFSLSFTLASLLGAAGFFWKLYERLWFFDDIAHAFCALATTLAFGTLLLHPLEESFRRSRLTYFISICAIGIAMGVGWEFFEWAVDHTHLAPHIHLLGDIEDTMMDLLMDTLGATIGALLATARISRPLANFFTVPGAL